MMNMLRKGVLRHIIDSIDNLDDDYPCNYRLLTTPRKWQEKLTERILK